MYHGIVTIYMALYINKEYVIDKSNFRIAIVPSIFEL